MSAARVRRGFGGEPGRAVALETTLLVHGVPGGSALPLHRELCGVVRAEGGEPALVGVVDGEPVVGMNDAELAEMLKERCETPGDGVPKANTSNLGVLIHRGATAATSVSATMELASRAGVRIFATGGLGGVHRGFSDSLDVSADLSAFARFPVAVVCSGVKSILDVAATREVLETLGIPVVGFGTGSFPAFYRRADATASECDARFDDAEELACFVSSELARTGRGVVVANPISERDEIDGEAFESWVSDAEDEARRAGAVGRGVTPFVLARLHELSGGSTLRANIALVRENARLAARLASAIASRR